MVEREQAKLPKETYRDLLQLRANGFEVSDHDLRVWRREEEIIRATLAYGCKMGASGLTPAHFLAKGHALAWRALEAVLERDPEAPSVEGATMMSEMHRLDPETLTGRRGAGWGETFSAEVPCPLQHVLSVLVPEMKRAHRARAWARKWAELSTRQGKDDAAVLHGAYVDGARDIAEQSYRDETLEGPLKLADWDAYSAEQPNVVPTGNSIVDRLAGGGIGRGDQMVVGGGTGDGKTFWALALGCGLARTGRSCTFISTEDPRDLIQCRLIAGYSEGGLHAADVRMKSADPLVVAQAAERADASLGGRFYLEVVRKPAIKDVLRLIRLHRYLHGVDVVVVDYLQAISEDDGPWQNKTQEVSSIVSKLKRCCSECGVALVLLSQYAREGYRDGAEPGLNSFKWCGDIENESEVVVCLWRDQEETLHVKVPKAKWGGNRRARWIIAVDPTSGWHGEWELDASEPAEEK